MTNDNTIPAKKEVTIYLLQSAYEEFEKEVRDSTVEQFIESVLTQKAYEIKEGGVTVLKQGNAELLLQALKKIENPIAAMQAELEDGHTLDGVQAIALSKDHTWLKDIARKAIEEYETKSTPTETFHWTPVTPDSPTFEGREIAIFRDARTKRIIRQEYVNSYTNNSIFIFHGEVEVPIQQLEWLAPTV